MLDRSGVAATYGDIDQTFPLASVTKLLTACAAHIAHEEGSLNLDEVVTPAQATLADLLAHAAGLAPDGSQISPPHRRRIYSNGGYELIGSLLESAAEMSTSEYLQAGLFDPLGMANTSLLSSPAHGATSTVRDLTSFLQGIPTLLATTTFKRMTSPHLQNLRGLLPGYGSHDLNIWGLGPEIRGTKDPHWTPSACTPETWGHFGQSGTFLWVDPIHNVATIVLTDRAFGDWATDRWPQLSEKVLSTYGS